MGCRCGSRKSDKSGPALGSAALAWWDALQHQVLLTLTLFLLLKSPLASCRAPENGCGDCACTGEPASPPSDPYDAEPSTSVGPIAVPKIYYATRTHSQIAQVVRELKRSGYTPKMSVLASRQNYCINKAVVRSGKIDEECEKLIKDQFGCSFHRNASKFAQAGRQVRGAT